MNVDQQYFAPVLDFYIDILHIDARFPSHQRTPDFLRQPTGRCGVTNFEYKIVNAAAEVRAHQPFSGRRCKNDPDGIPDVIFRLSHLDLIAPIEVYWKCPSFSKK